MATFEKRKKGWRAQVCKGGVRVSKVLMTKSEARMWAAEKEAEIANGALLKPSQRTVGDLLDKYRLEVTPAKKSADWETARIGRLRREGIASVKLDALSPLDLSTWRDERLKSVKSSTVNRDLNILSAAFNVSIYEWGWLKLNPIKQIKRPKNPKPRDVRISDADIQRVLRGLGYEGRIASIKSLVAVMFLFALETAMRLGEICALRAGDVRDSHVIIRDSKNGDTRRVPLSRRAQGLVAQIMDSGLTTSADSASATFLKMARREGLGFVFHDSRHEALTQLAKKLDVLDLARMVGHRDPRSLMIYYNPTMDELASRLG